MKTVSTSPASVSTVQALVRAAAYARMSTEHQMYSIENQMSAIREYAAVHGMTVVREYLDPGRSGLDLKGRPALVQLLTDVQEGRADYQTVLVYDVSRWGRFQDTDESAFYEFVCRKAYIQIVYCAEPFDNERGGSLASIIKNVKRIMAAEYSRDQSVRVRRAKLNVAARGYLVGGTVPFGFKRMLVSSDGAPRMILEPGMHKALSTERVLMVPGPMSERRLVRRVYRLYTKHHLTAAEIANRLNRERKRNSHGAPWASTTIRYMLRNEAYLGRLIYNRVSQILKTRRRPNERHNWVCIENAFKPIVSVQLFESAQAERKRRSHRRYTDEELLSRLRRLLKKNGRLSKDVIRTDARGPHVSIIIRRFGGLMGAYKRIGFTYQRTKASFEFERRLNEIANDLRARIIAAVRAKGGRVEFGPERGAMLTINGRMTVSLAMARYSTTPARKEPRWDAYTRRLRNPKFVIVARMDVRNEEVFDYFLLPTSEIRGHTTHIHAGNMPARKPYHCASFTELTKRLLTRTPGEPRWGVMGDPRTVLSAKQRLEATGRSPWPARLRGSR